MSIKVRCEVAVLEVDGKAVDANIPVERKPVLVFESNWRGGAAEPTIVVLIDGKRYTVSGADAQTAIINVRNR